MISIENREAFAKAEAKARAIKPHVSVVKFGEYRVAASSGRDFYTVKFTRTTTGHWVASCTCPAHVADGRPDYPPKPCYHIPSAYSVSTGARYSSASRAGRTAPATQVRLWQAGLRSLQRPLVLHRLHQVRYA
jgi:hypothetical protein